MEKKTKTMVLALALCLGLLAGCAAGESSPPDIEEEPAQEDTLTARIVSVGEGDSLLLAGESAGDIYRLSAQGLPVKAASGETLASQALEPGAMVTVSFFGGIMETYPARPADVTAVTVLEEEFDNLCALYAQVLEDLWAVDSGLNESGMEYVGVDLSKTRLTPGEQSALAWAFGESHGLMSLEGSWEELVEEGYITSEPLDPEKPGENLFYQWPNGCAFALTEKEEAEGSGDTVTFDATKWRSSLGAYSFCDCSASRDEEGRWGGYRVGAEMIS